MKYLVQLFKEATALRKLNFKIIKIEYLFLLILMSVIVLFFKVNSVVCFDAPDVWQFRFQDPASSSMEGILLFNKHILFVITVIVLLVSWILINTIENYNIFNNSNSTNFYHDNKLEIVWTCVPALILLSLASPSFSLLYSMDELSVPNFSIKILGHQWLWTYEISDFKSCLKSKTLKYACYMLTNENLSQYKGFLGFLKLTNELFFLQILTWNY